MSEKCHVDADARTAKRYHQRAEEVRVIADGMTDPTNRKVLLAIAADYERMAFSMERIDQTDRNLAAFKSR
jgi:hypothetical protein